MHDSGALSFDELVDLWGMVCAKVVHHEDISGMQPRTEAVAEEFKEPIAVHRPRDHLMTNDSGCSDRADDAERTAPVRWLSVERALPDLRPSAAWCHPDVASGFVQEDESFDWNLRYRRDEDGALFDVFWPLSLTWPVPFFFQEYPARARARTIAERLKDTPKRFAHSSASSCAGASGRSATIASRTGISSSGIRGGKPPECPFGATVPRSRSARSQRETLASPIEKILAIS